VEFRFKTSSNYALSSKIIRRNKCGTQSNHCYVFMLRSSRLLFKPGKYSLTCFQEMKSQQKELRKVF